MNLDIEDFRDFIWVFPLIGGIITLISLFTPAAFVFRMWDFVFFWMWGLLVIHYSSIELGTFNSITFNDNMLILIPSIISSIVIFISVIILFVSSYFCRRERNEQNIIKSRGLGPSILIIVSTILWMITIEIAFIGPVSISFWNTYNSGFGVIGMFLGAIVAIIGYGISRYIVKQG